MSWIRRDFVAFGLLASAVGIAGCSDKQGESESVARDRAASAATFVTASMGEVKRGLPQSAAILGKHIAADPGADLLGLQRSISAARDGVQDLRMSKIAFCSFVDATGVVVRSETDPDLLATKNVFPAFPDLKKATEAGSALVETFGEMDEMRGVKTGPDLVYVAAHVVKDEANAVRGELIAGFSLRVLAYYVEETAKRENMEAASKVGNKNPPVLYAFVFKGPKVLAPPRTPDVNAEALEKLDLPGKTQNGPYKGAVEISGRTFGIAAERTPELAPDAGVAVIASAL